MSGNPEDDEIGQMMDQAFRSGEYEGALAEADLWDQAIDQVLAHYPETAFIPGGTSIDAQSADMVRVTCRNIRRVHSELTGEERDDD